MKIVITDAYAVNPGDLSWDFLNKYGEVAIYDNTPNELAQQRLQDADVALINKVQISKELLCKCPNLKLICVLATGYNVVDCEAARQQGIVVCNVPGYGTNAVAQFTFSLLLELCNRVGHHDKLVHDGVWSRCRSFCFWDTPQMELAGKTLGIIGFGSIGRAVGTIAKAFGMKVLAYNRSRCAEGEAIAAYVDLDVLLENADMISLHCPMTPETDKLINTETLSKMRRGTILLNTARGQLVDEAAVAAALESGKLRGYAADVVSQEPILPDNPLLTAPNCVLTPHMAWAPIESRQRILDITRRNIESFLSGTPTNVVNKIAN